METFKIQGIPAIIYGKPSDKVFLFVHGKLGCKENAESFAAIASQSRRIEKWDAPTSILYGSEDNLTERKTVDVFAERFNCKLTVMPGGEHWFHTPEQLDVLEKWTKDAMIGCNDHFSNVKNT